MKPRPPRSPLFPYTTLFRSPSMKIEVEADNLEQVRALVQIEGVDVILLDNMETAEMREAIALGRKHNVKFEASGGINLDRKSTRLNSSHTVISYAVFCLKKK